MTSPLRVPRSLLPFLIALPFLVLLAGGAVGLFGPRNTPVATPPETVYCDLQLRSWRVFAQGRHLYLDCDCPPPYAHLSGRIEFSSATLRFDFDPAAASALIADDPQWAPPTARMSRGFHLSSPDFITDPADRLEQAYRVPSSAAEILQHDRAYSLPYRLLGPNSNSAIRAVMHDAQIPIPDRILASGGTLGAFPGIAQSPSVPLPDDQWARAALTQGPTPIPSPTHQQDSVKIRPTAADQTNAPDTPSP